MPNDRKEFVAEDLCLLIAVVTFGTIALVGFIGLEAVAGFVAIVGWFLLTPIFLFWGEEIAEWLYGEEPAPPADDGEDDALAELKRRYARGEVSEAEFERRGLEAVSPG
ncbi:SHOCT domain-containing protein [Natrialbaceae archaeon A-gly3]